jgi:predicted acylesterase/phospholipase RssA
MNHSVPSIGAKEIGAIVARYRAALVQEGMAALQRERAAAAAADRADPLRSPAYFLAISGGGDDGAFGAGLLCGWYDSGTIPTFKLVTGASTGSMIAPFAFLGGPYYERPRTLYATITPDDVFTKRGLYSVIFGDALLDTTPLFRFISRYVDRQMLADIAGGYDKGRLLLIGTTDLDDQRPVIWNIGAIAAGGRPGLGLDRSPVPDHYRPGARDDICQA